MIEGAEACSIEFFKRRAHLYDIGVSDNEHLPDLLSSMQHHGCPTRLLDFTTSFYIATYFAVRSHVGGNRDYCVWAINFPVLRSKAAELARITLDRNGPNNNEQLRSVVYKLMAIKPLGVIHVEPARISRRMSAQQGILLAQTNIRTSFAENLYALMEIEGTPPEITLAEFAEITRNIVNSIYVIKFVFSDKRIQSVRKDLLSFNVTSETLFPDLEGVAKSAVEHFLWQY